MVSSSLSAREFSGGGKSARAGTCDAHLQRERVGIERKTVNANNKPGERGREILLPTSARSLDSEKMDDQVAFLSCSLCSGIICSCHFCFAFQTKQTTNQFGGAAPSKRPAARPAKCFNSPEPQRLIIGGQRQEQTKEKTTTTSNTRPTGDRCACFRLCTKL